jgi:hypothetical protein
MTAVALTATKVAISDKAVESKKRPQNVVGISYPYVGSSTRYYLASEIGRAALN